MVGLRVLALGLSSEGGENEAGIHNEEQASFV